MEPPFNSDEAMTPAAYKRATADLDRPLTWHHARHHAEHIGADTRALHAETGGQQDGRRVAPLPVTGGERMDPDVE